MPCWSMFIRGYLGLSSRKQVVSSGTRLGQPTTLLEILPERKQQSQVDLDGVFQRPGSMSSVSTWVLTSQQVQLFSQRGALRLLFLSLGEIYITKGNIFKVQDLAAFSTFTVLCDHDLYVLLKHSHRPDRKPYL